MDVLDVLLRALEWAKERDYAGYDPFDALSSPIINRLAGNNRALRILFTQLFKRSPVDMREAFGMAPTRNPKGIALFASAYDNLYRIYGEEMYKKERDQLIGWLKKSTKADKVCFGYNFPWQSRRSYLQEGEGCSVVTFFVGETPVLKSDKNVLHKIARFYLEELNVLLENDKHLSLSYTPYEEEEKVVNSNALIGYQLVRIGKLLGNETYIDKGEKIINWVVSQQQKNGGWIYSPSSHLGMDNFHNGYVIWALMKYREVKGGKDNRVDDAISQGLDFYKTMFVGGRPLYSTETEYPVDIHNCAQGIITFKEARGMGYYRENIYEDIISWSLENMWNDEKNYFYYQQNRLFTNKIPYMRWSQAWMCYAMSIYLSERSSA